MLKRKSVPIWSQSFDVYFRNLLGNVVRYGIGSSYGGMLIFMAEQGAAISGIEIDPERARMGK